MTFDCLRDHQSCTRRVEAGELPLPYCNDVLLCLYLCRGPFGVALALGVMFYSFQRAMTWRRARTRSQNSAVAPTTPLPPEDSAINEPGPRRTGDPALHWLTLHAGHQNLLLSYLRCLIPCPASCLAVGCWATSPLTL